MVQGPGSKVQGPGSGARRYNARVQARYAVAIGVVFGLLLGLGGYTFVYARGASYLTNDPPRARTATSCASSSTAGSGRATARRGLQRLPRAARPRRQVRRPRRINGFWHSFYFTTGTFPRADPDHAAQRRGHREALPQLPRRHRPRHRHGSPRRRARSPACAATATSGTSTDMAATTIDRAA